MLDPKAEWFKGYRSITDDRLSDSVGDFRIRVLDFTMANDRTLVRQPSGVKRFGWLLYVGGENDPLVGSEDRPDTAIARAKFVRNALSFDIPVFAGAFTCAGCAAVIIGGEPCSGCGRTVCEPCFETKGGCGCDSQGDRAIPRTEELAAQVETVTSIQNAEMAHPTAYIPTTLADETARLQAIEDDEHRARAARGGE